jgi:hypothetical protein
MLSIGSHSVQSAPRKKNEKKKERKKERKKETRGAAWWPVNANGG